MLKPALNCDIGEGTGNEEQIMSLIDSCSIACGGHTGNSQSMETAILLAKENNVLSGAHPSFPDQKNFGRVSMKMEADALIASIQKQLKSIDLLLEKHNIPLHHIKAHGALYNDAIEDSGVASVYLKAIEAYKERCFIYLPPGSEIASLAKKLQFNIKYEAFGDRTYRDDLSLVSRREPGAVIEDKKKVYEQINSIISRGRVITDKENCVHLSADTFCIHSDTKNAVSILEYLNKQFQNK